MPSGRTELASRVTSTDVLGAGLASAAFLVTTVFSSSLASIGWSPHVAIMLIVGGAGLPIVIREAWKRRNPAACAAIAWVVVAAIATALSEYRVASVFGLYGWGPSLLFIVSLCGWWGAGLAATTRIRGWVEWAIIAGIYTNVAVALGQAGSENILFPYATTGSRAFGLTGGPSELGTLSICGLCLVGARLSDRPTAWFALAPLSFAIQVSGGRGVLVLLVPVALWLARKRPLVTRGALVVAILAGLLFGLVVQEAGSNSRASASTRLGDADNGIDLRVEGWSSATHALRRQPVFGSGPGTFRHATARDQTLQLARLGGPTRLFFDAHNLFVEYAITTGILGLTTLLLFLMLALASGDGPARAAALAGLAVHLYQPQSVMTTPLLFLLMAFAYRHRDPEPDDLRRPTLIASSLLSAVAGIAGVLLLVGDHALQDVRRGGSLARARTAEAVLPAWPQPALAMATAYETRHRAEVVPELVEASLRWYREAAQRDPTDPGGWRVLGHQLLAADHPAEARSAYARSLDITPYSTVGLNGLARAEAALNNRGAAIAALRRSLAVSSDQPEAEQLLRGLEDRPVAAGPPSVSP